MSKIIEDFVYQGTMSTKEIIIRTEKDTTLIIDGIWISNSNSTENITVTVKLDERRFIPSLSIDPKDTIVENDLGIPLLPGKTLKILSTKDEDIDYYIWGKKEMIE